MLNAPIPTCPSRRLVGLELEYDAGNTEFRRPIIPDGWSEKYDGSLSNGREYVMDPPVAVCNADDSIRAFCEACDTARMNTTSRGGFHVHVQSPDFGGETDEAQQRVHNLARLYVHFQDAIDRLVGKSRVHNHFCAKFGTMPTRSELVNLFRLDQTATSRLSAKGARSTKVINFAMCRTQNKSHRSIEFRQGSPSKQFACVWGWTVFVVALTEIAARDDFNLPEDRSLDSLLSLLRAYERDSGATKIAKWVLWRDDYMNRPPTDDEVNKVVASANGRPRGIFHLSRQAELNLPLTQRAADEAVRRGLLSKVGNNRWVSAYSQSQGPSDLSQLLAQLS